MSKQPSLNPEMRAILIDWLVEVQVSFPQTLAAKLDARKENYSLSVVVFLKIRLFLQHVDRILFVCVLFRRTSSCTMRPCTWP